MSDSRFSALKSCGNGVDRLDFWGNSDPRCPHCGATCPVSENEWWHLYEEGEHEVTCPSCTDDFSVTTDIKYSFSTDEQGAEA